jgi:NAD+ kinase
MKIGIVSPTDQKEVCVLKENIVACLNSKKIDVIDQVGPEDLVDQDFVIAIGGDGTVLKAVSIMSNKQVPIMGVNMGHLGYLTEVEPGLVLKNVEKLLSGNFTLERRMLLGAQIFIDRKNSYEEIKNGFVALNDVVVEKVEPGKTIRFELEINGLSFENYSADGIIVSTPTGSTAYNFSIRGPIVEPSLDSIIVTPIAPHLVFDRSLVLDPSTELKLINSSDRKASLVIDGKVRGVLEEFDGVKIVTKKEHIELVKFDESEYFIKRLKSKF